MRRSHRPFLFAPLVVAVVIAACSKKSSPPTAPVPEPACTLSATSLDFGDVAVGTSADRSFTLSNAGGSTLSGTVTESSAEFALIGTTTYALGTGQGASFTLRFTPTSAGTKACTLATGATSCSVVVARGTGQVIAPVCDVSPTTLDFGAVNYGGSTNRVVTVRNTGGGTLAGAVSVSSNLHYSTIGDATFSLGAGAVASFFVQFRPSTGGAQPCTVRVSPGGCAPVTGSGFGLLPLSGNCALRVTSGDTLDFGDVAVGHMSERSVTIQNTSSTYQSVGGGSDICPDFEANFSGNFLPGGSGPRAVRFSPTRIGEQYCAVPLSCSMTGSGTNAGVGDYIILRGVGVTSGPTCQLSATVIDFQQVTVGQTKDLTFTITNVGVGVLSGAVGPSHCPEFAYIGSTSYSLGSGASATFTVRYTPSNPGHTTSCAVVPAGAACPAMTFVGEAVGP